MLELGLGSGLWLWLEWGLDSDWEISVRRAGESRYNVLVSVSARGMSPACPQVEE
jgi:hypothetical protein